MGSPLVQQNYIILLLNILKYEFSLSLLYLLLCKGRDPFKFWNLVPCKGAVVRKPLLVNHYALLYEGKGSLANRYEGYLHTCFLKRLFLPQEYLYRTSGKFEMLAEPILQKSLVRISDILRKIAEECK